jgi:hypothetical protein
MARTSGVRTIAPLLLLAGTLGCGESFLPGFLITEERVLAIVADPPETSPGQPVTLTPLIASPDGTIAPGDGYESEWWKCPESDSDGLQDATRCTSFDKRVVLGSDAVHTDTVPADIFPLPDPDADPEEPQSERLLGALLGYWRVIGLTADFSPSTDGGRDVDAIKRVVVSPPAPLALLDERLADLDVRVGPDGEFAFNTNPALTGVTVHEGALDGPEVTKLTPGETYFLSPSVDEERLEAYHSLKVNLDGLDLGDPGALQALPEEELLARFERVVRCELPLFSWYVKDGDLRRENTIDEQARDRVFTPRGVECPTIEGEARDPAVRFVAPDKPEGLQGDYTVHAWVVLRDGRGGTDFLSFDLLVE